MPLPSGQVWCLCLSKGWETRQPFPRQELRHQPAEKQGRAHVSARPHREIQLCDFDLLPWFLLGWFRIATQSRATAPERRGALAPVFQSCSSAPLRAGLFTYNPRGTRGGSQSALAGRVNPVPPIRELDGPRAGEVTKQTEEKRMM